MIQVSDVAAFLKRHADPALAEEWDNVGLLVGNRGSPVERVMTCLTLTPDVAREAIERQAGLIVTHHPVLFKGVKRLTSDDSQGAMLLELIAARVAVYSPHTGYDSAAEGINWQLARLLGLADVAPLQPLREAKAFKIVCFVPHSHLAVVQKALWKSGAGEIGEYSQCGFVIKGTGSFRGSESSNPAVGKPGRLERVAEARLEVDCPRDCLASALKSLCDAHPYEEPAYDVYSLESAGAHAGGQRGVGRVGQLPAEMPLSKFAELVKKKLRIECVQFVGDARKPVRRVGIACGAGTELLPAARDQGCCVLLTGEARFHTCLEAQAADIALVLAGHYATERPAMEHLAQVISREFPSLETWASQSETDPVQTR